ncbi:MAG: hypothetical protein IKA31_04145 [Clostridia bacterium]|nr:hypothetical protein [Clostridia bacterium]
MRTKKLQDYEKNLIDETLKDFEKRREERKSFDAQWQLNMNFYMGNQYCTISRNNEIEEYEKQFFWQEKEVYNHIMPTMEVRISKLDRVRPTMCVVPATTDDRDIKTAKLSKKIINSINSKKDLSKIISEATNWSEITGTAFYKVIWNNDAGVILGTDEDGNQIKSGEVEICVCSPFEIFPESTSCENLEDSRSVIHAKAYHKDYIKSVYGVEVEGEEINVFTLDNAQSGIGGLGYTSKSPKVISTKRSDYAVVIEKYVAPTVEYPNGRLIIIAGDKLVFDGELPFINGVDGTRTYPFIKQTSLNLPACFWGTSVIERLIPVQRAYNAVKNRKHEFLNRISMGVLSVEDGSVDIDNLEEEGLSPGKILVYRQGASAPRFMTSQSVPTDFTIEEQRLENEFLTISGVSDLMKNLSSYSNMSGTALQLLIEQDDSRLTTTTENIKSSIKQIAQHTLRLYKQFAIIPRYRKIIGDNGEVEMFYFSQSDISSDDVNFETETEISETLAQRRNMVFELLNAGLLSDENGKLSNRMRVKALELLGFGVWENSQDINELHTKRASEENIGLLKNEKLRVLEIDDHDLHISEHIAFMLKSDFIKKCEKNEKLEEKMLSHIREHKKFKNITNVIENKEN